MEANGSGSSSDSAPDCWDQADLEPGNGSAAAAAAVEEEEEEEEAAVAAAAPGSAQLEAEEEQLLGAAFSRHLNVNAKPFVPNVHAAEFVPAFLRGGPGQPAPPPPPPSPPPGLPPPPPPPSLTHGASAESSHEHLPSCEGSNAIGMEISEPVEETIEPELASGPSGDAGPIEESTQEMMEEEEEMPKPKSMVAPPGAPKKEHVNVVFIGHVDAGKSTIGGQIMYLSWALDTNQEERDKGKTVEVGRAYFETEKKHFTILDAPGHKSFVPNMIGGASQADLAVLEIDIVKLVIKIAQVISARKGEFETGFEKGGQTREHAMLAKTAGVKHLIVLINKMDDPTVNWSNERQVLEFSSALCRNCTGLPFIPYLDNLPNFSRSVDGPIRLPIVDKYKDMGTVVLGKLESGSICKGQQLVMMPNKIVIIEHKSIICPGYNAVLHIHTCIEEVEITALICLVDKKSGEKSKTRPRFVKQDQVCIARLRTAGTICLETFKDFPQMGRFTLRDEAQAGD
ncbi:hypothetical protein Chor_015191 [Crotalus horridus]